MQWSGRICGFVLALLAGGAVSAATVTWTVTGGTFSDGGTVSGTFVQDTASNTATSGNLSVAGGGASFPARSYTPANSTVSTLLLIGGTQPSLLFHATDEFPRELRLTPVSALDGSVASVNLDVAFVDGNVECFNCSPFRPITTGSLVLTSAAPAVTLVSAAPNPATAGVTTTVTVSITGIGAFGPPTGTVTVLDNGSNPLCAITLPGTSCAFTPAAAGVQALVARYDGDGNYATASSDPFSLPIGAPLHLATPQPIPALGWQAIVALAAMLGGFVALRRTKR
jgi:hypothetical protein